MFARPQLHIPRGGLRRGGALLCALGLVACGAASEPDGATPMPEPPSLDGGRIGPTPSEFTPLSYPRLVSLSGEAGAASPGASIRVLNLDLLEAPTTVTAAADGSFEITVLASAGDELRFQALQGGRRSAPVDFIFTDGLGGIDPSPRHACVSLQPGFDLALSGERGSVRFQNDCAEPVQLAAPRFRAGNDFALVTALPLMIAAGESASVELELRNPPPPAREDVWFVEVTRGPEPLRYPVGVRTE